MTAYNRAVKMIDEEFAILSEAARDKLKVTMMSLMQDAYERGAATNNRRYYEVKIQWGVKGYVYETETIAAASLDELISKISKKIDNLIKVVGRTMDISPDFGENMCGVVLSLNKNRTELDHNHQDMQILRNKLGLY